MVYVNIYATIIIWTANNFVLRDIDNVELQELLITGHGGPGLIRTKIISSVILTSHLEREINHILCV